MAAELHVSDTNTTIAAFGGAFPPAGTLSDQRPNADSEFPRHAGDPVARFLREKLHADWPQLLIAALLVYGPIEKIILPHFGNYLTLGADVKGWRPDIETLLTGFVEFPVFFAIYLWIGADISRVFRRLGENKSFANEQAFLTFTKRASNAFARREAWLGSVGLAVLVTVWVNVYLWDGSPPLPWWDQGIQQPFLSIPRVFSWILIPMLVYAVSQIIIREALAIIWWRKMWDEPNALVLHPYHSDGAAGLGAIGQHAVGISYFLLGMTLFVFMGSLLPSLRYGNKILFATVDTITVTAGVVGRPYGDRSVTYSGHPDLKGHLQATFAVRPMALSEGRVLHMRIKRLPSTAEARNDHLSIDSLKSGRRAVSPVHVIMHTNPEKFEVALESSPLPATIPTFRLFGIPMSLWNPGILVEWIGLLALLAFTLPPLLWPAHEAMERALNSQLNALSRDLDEHLQTANAALSTDPDKFKAAMDAVSRTKQIRTTLLEDCETWPLNADLRRRLGISSGISIGSSALNLVAAGGMNLLRQLT